MNTFKENFLIKDCETVHFMKKTQKKQLKELRNRILRTTLVWSLFCLTWLYVGLHFLTGSFRKLVFRLSALSLNQDIKICVIMLRNFDM